MRRRMGRVPDMLVLAAMVVLLAMVVGPALWAGNRDTPEARDQCFSNMKQLGSALLQYCLDWDERMPLANRWCTGMLPYHMSRALYQCPAVDAQFGYAMNGQLSRRYLRDIHEPSRVIALYDSARLRPNACDNPGDGLVIPVPGRHTTGSGAHVNRETFADGHVKFEDPWADRWGTYTP